MKPRTTAAVLAASALTLAASLLVAGPLNPPPGAVASTLKTLGEVEPRIAINATNTPGDADSVFRISLPGSYYLPGNVAIAAFNKSGIEIAANNVTIDLMGFSFAGVISAEHGIRTSGGTFNNITIRNGTISAFPGDGVDLTSGGTAIGSGARLENLTISGNGGVGLRAGHQSTVENCRVRLNAGEGIRVGDGSLVSACVAAGNTLQGIRAGDGGTIRECVATGNASTGILVGVSAKVSGCSVTGNLAGDIFTADRSAVTNSSAIGNTGVGITVTNSCTVAECSVQNNTLDGILCNTACLIRGNSCVLNGNGVGSGAGIHVTGPDNHIEKNICYSADRGIDVDSPANFIIRNTCSANGLNWDVVANNGLLVVLVAPGAAVVGNTGGVASGSTDPNANFTH